MQSEMRRQIGTIVWIVSGLLILNSCSWLLGKAVKDPQIKIERVDVAEVQLQGAKLNFVLSVSNPNNFEIKVDRVEYKVFLGEKYFAEAKMENSVAIKPKQETQVQLPLPVDYTKLASGIGPLLRGEPLTYRIQGRVQLNLLGIHIPFDESGQISF